VLGLFVYIAREQPRLWMGGDEYSWLRVGRVNGEEEIK